MKIALSIISILLILVGGVWILQGTSIISGSLMTGQGQWTIIGSIAALLGIVLLVFANRRRAPVQEK